MKLFYLALLILGFGFNAVSAQNDLAAPAIEKISNGSEYDKHYNKLKELEIKQLTSESHKKYRKIHKSFYDYVQKQYRRDVPYNDVLNWIFDNIEKTTFGSYENAEMEWNIVNTAQAAYLADNKEYFDFVLICVEKFDKKLFIDVQKEIIPLTMEVYFSD